MGEARVRKLSEVKIPWVRVDRFYPFGLALAAGLLSWVWEWAIGEDQALLLSASITFGAIVSGFVGTSLSILTSLSTRVMDRIRGTSYIYDLRSDMGWALFAGMVVCCVSMAGMLFEFYSSAIYTAFWISAMMLCLACLYRLSKLMLLIFTDHENRPLER